MSGFITSTLRDGVNLCSHILSGPGAVKGRESMFTYLLISELQKFFQYFLIFSKSGCNPG